MNDYQQLIHLSRYARWNTEKNRRETWDETVKRYCDFFRVLSPRVFPYDDIYRAIYNLEVMPSMRAIMTAGPALERDNIAAFNCSYLPIDHPRAFDEIMYILMCGTGVGFSVEEKYVEQLPTVAEDLHSSDTTIIVADSRIGWASGFRELISLLYSGKIPKWDISRVRAAGERLKTFGGRASGPGPLNQLFESTVVLFKKAAGRKLTTEEVHDLVCRIADVVIVGGVRRSALISLSSLGDTQMAKAKMGSWWIENPQRSLANNSAVYTSKPKFETFLNEWRLLYESKSGERGFFNRESLRRFAGNNQRRDVLEWEYGTNPCGEIILRPQGLCNLTEVVCRPTDTVETLKSKVEIASIIGTFQSTLTNFRYIRKAWKRNAEEERLLGVSLTGIYDCDLTATPSPKFLEELRDVAISTNSKWAKKIGINASVAVTCVKPSGTVSQLAGCSSGIHPSYADYYVRSVRMDNKDPICRFLKEQGIRNEPEVFHPDSQTVFYFPMKGSGVTGDQVSAMQHLNLYLLYRKHWCEHNPSITVNYTDDEFLDVGSFIWKNWDDIGGISFLPKSDHVYQQAPYTKITEEEYNSMMENQCKIDWSKYYNYEKEDETTATQELACVSGVCEL